MKLQKIAALCCIAAGVFLTACPEPKPGPDNGDGLVEDGVYLVGAASAYAEPVPEGAFWVGINEADNQAPRNTMFEKYVALKSGESFHIEVVAGAETKKIGGTLVGTVENPGTGDQPNTNCKVSTYTAADNGTITVAEDGLYHIIYEKSINKIVIASVVYGVRGDVNGWGFTAGTASAFNKEKVTFTLADLQLRKGTSYKLAYGGGWKLFIDTTSTPTVNVNTNFGGALSALVPGGGNISPEATAIYKLAIEWSHNSANKYGFLATLTKTGDLQNTDWSGHKAGLRGGAGFCPEATADAWDANLHNADVVKNGQVYTWTINVTLVTDKEFKVVTEAPDGNAGWIGFNDATKEGPSVDKFADAGGNFKCIEGGEYEIVLTIDADNGDSKKLKLTKK